MLMFNEFFVYFFYHYVFNQNILFFAKVLCFLRRDTFKKKSEQRVTIVSCIIKVVFVYIYFVQQVYMLTVGSKLEVKSYIYYITPDYTLYPIAG